MAKEPEVVSTSGASTGVERGRMSLADARLAAGRALDRVRGRKRSVIGDPPGAGGTSAADDTLRSPTNVADADVSVQRAWRNVRVAIAIIAAVVPVVTALISWRVRASRARRRGQFVDL